MPETKRIVISGGPATGKTTIVNALSHRGYHCLPEFSREIIRAEMAAGTDVLPWDNLPAFTKKVISGRIDQFHSAKPGIQFYDRSVIDSLAYMHLDKLPVKEDWNAFLENHRYHKTVFITEPWRDIFEMDGERKESWEKLLHLHEYIVSAYQDWGYEVCFVPKLDVEQRVDFILSAL